MHTRKKKIILRKIRNRLKDRWIKGHYSWWSYEGGDKHCLVGFVQKYSPDESTKSEILRDLRSAIGIGTLASIEEWNDKEKRKVEEVEDVVNRTILSYDLEN